MPCENHSHHWPTDGVHTLAINSCETRCGWCKYITDQVTNLRAHARTHLKNEFDEALKGITIQKFRAGRPRVQMEQQHPRKRQRIAPLEPDKLIPSLNGRDPGNYDLKKATSFSATSAHIQAREPLFRGRHESESQWHNVISNSRESNTSAFSREKDHISLVGQEPASMYFSPEPPAGEKDLQYNRPSAFYLPPLTTTYSIPTPRIAEQMRDSRFWDLQSSPVEERLRRDFDTPHLNASSQSPDSQQEENHRNENDPARPSIRNAFEAEEEHETPQEVGVKSYPLFPTPPDIHLKTHGFLPELEELLGGGISYLYSTISVLFAPPTLASARHNEFCESCLVRAVRDGIRSIAHENLLLAPQGVSEEKWTLVCYHLAAQREKEDGDRTFYSCVRITDLLDFVYVDLLPPGTMLPSGLLQYGVVALTR